ncbi:MAG: DNA replication/repair protein RecF [Propionibacterium sp.]|nr:DNA replication/repair protein RecF [Propionibacterium sp.]
MFVDHLTLADFRSYPEAELELTPGVCTFVGANGQGKTNLVEAVEYLSTGASHRVTNDEPLVRAGAEYAVVRARVRAGLADDRALVLELEIRPGRSNRAKLNRAALPRARELIGVLRSVVFSPEDLAIVKGDPNQRRRFLDHVVTTRWPRMAGVRADYDKVLKQRTALLKVIGGKGNRRPDPDALPTLEIWDEQLAGLGAELLSARLDTLADMWPHVQQAYADIAPTNNRASGHYRASAPLGDSHDRAELTEVLLTEMRQRRSEEIARGVSLVGPHRDDVDLILGELPAKGYASHGESWSYALALRLAAFVLLQDDGVEPVLVLDDVFAELDTTRRERLATRVVQAEQVLITAAVAADIPDTLAANRWQVTMGEVRRAPHP